MLVGGALAGLGGLIESPAPSSSCGPGCSAGYGYIGFLACWLGRHDPLKMRRLAPLLLGAIAVGGDSLQIDTGLPAAP